MNGLFEIVKQKWSVTELEFFQNQNQVKESRYIPLKSENGANNTQEQRASDISQLCKSLSVKCR